MKKQMSELLESFKQAILDNNFDSVESIKKIILNMVCEHNPKECPLLKKETKKE